MKIGKVFFAWDWELGFGISRLAGNRQIRWLLFLGFLTISTVRLTSYENEWTTFCIPPMPKDKGKLWTFIREKEMNNARK